MIVLVFLAGFFSPVYSADTGGPDVRRYAQTFYELYTLHHLVSSAQSGDLVLTEAEREEVLNRLTDIMEEGLLGIGRTGNRPAVAYVQRTVFNYLPESVTEPANRVIAVAVSSSSLEEKRETLRSGILGLACLGFSIPALVLFIVGVALLPLVIPSLVLLPLSVIFYTLYIGCIIIL